MSKSDRRLETKDLTEYEKLLKNILSKPCPKNKNERDNKLAKSPLASPYFVSRLLPNDALDYDALTFGDAKLGRALFEAISQVYNSLWQDGKPQHYERMEAKQKFIGIDIKNDDYHAFHLELRFFQEFLCPSNRDAIIADLKSSQADEFRLFNGTIRKVGEMLLSLLGPYRQVLPHISKKVVGMDSNLSKVQQWIQSNLTVNLIGQGGIGKSTLAALIAHDSPNDAFWYTVRPNLNDRLGTFLSELGYFLHQQGSSNLWKLILVQGGSVQDSHMALNMLSEDLRTYQTSLPLLIIDEVDRLYNPDPDVAKSQHIEFLEFLESVRGQTPLLFVGQQAVLESDNYLELVGLAPFQIEELLKQLNISPLPSQPDIERLHRATQGNPRLLLLCIALYEQERGDDPHVTLDAIITIVSQTPGFGPVLNRLWDRLRPNQRELLQRLSVYTDSAPETYWPVEQNHKLNEDAQRLLDLRLVEKGAHGSVRLLPALRERIYSEKLIPNLREIYHLDAAAVLEPLAEYTNAAYHLAKGGEITQAIQLWYPMMRREIQRGQAGIAYTVFINMTYRNLPKDERQALIEIQAHLHEIYGEIQEGLDTIKLEKWSEGSEQSARVWAIRGKFENALGLRFPDAEKSYARSLETITRLIAQSITFHRGYGFVHIHDGKLDDAEATADAAEQELLTLRGTIAFQRSQWHEAFEYFERSLTLAMSLKEVEKIAISHEQLSAVYTRRRQFEKAVWHAEEAKLSYDDVGNRFKSARVDYTLTGTYFEMGDYQKSIEVGKRTVRFFEAIKAPFFAANTGATVAEAYFKLGDYEQAEQVANHVLGHEEPHSIPYAYFTLGLVSEANGDFQMAALYFKRSLDVAESNADRLIAAYARRGYGKMLCQTGEMDQGLEQLRHALAQFERIDQPQEVESTQLVLSNFTS